MKFLEKHEKIQASVTKLKKSIHNTYKINRRNHNHLTWDLAQRETHDIPTSPKNLILMLPSKPFLLKSATLSSSQKDK